MLIRYFYSIEEYSDVQWHEGDNKLKRSTYLVEGQEKLLTICCT